MLLERFLGSQPELFLAPRNNVSDRRPVADDPLSGDLNSERNGDLERIHPEAL